MIENEFVASYMTDHPDMATTIVKALPVEVIEPEDIRRPMLFVSEDSRYIAGGLTFTMDAGVTSAERYGA